MKTEDSINKITDPKDKFFHRDLSWLAFNERVLEEAQETQNPLLERLRFLAIATNNLDEFFMVRVAGLIRLSDAGYNKKDKFGWYPQELYDALKIKISEHLKAIYETYNSIINKDLKKYNVFIKTFDALTPEQKKYAKKYFDITLFPITTPMAVDQGHPFPVIASRRRAFAVILQKGDQSHLALIPIPTSVPDLLKLPSELNEFCFILKDEIIRNYLKDFFRGYKIKSSSLFRLIRDSELLVDEEFAPDLLKAISDEIKKRQKAKVVRLSVENNCDYLLLKSLCEALEYPLNETIKINGELDLSFLNELSAQVPLPQLSYPSFVPAKVEYENIFDKINEGDFIIHVPFQFFQPTVDLINSAAKDPDVLAIKMTLYRTNSDSGIIKGLKEAAKRKKQVTVLVEIKARFDEEQNINWVCELEESGCHVIYGMPGMKVHSKVALIVRKEGGRIRRYVHLSTGNYNEKTARIYTDIGYFTSNDDFARDISEAFNFITGYSIPSKWKRIISSPYDMRKFFFKLITKEIEFQKKFNNGFIFAKMNSLEDIDIIEKLYEASQAGVKIQLIVRGICSLVPGIPGLSENIKVKSIVGRFLEHSRIYIFNNNSDYRVFLSSADWMTRNFDRRVELLFEVLKDDIKEHLKFIMDTQWKDTVKSRFLLSDKRYFRHKDKEDKLNSQEFFLSHYSY